MGSDSLKSKLDAAKKKAADSLGKLDRAMRWLEMDSHASDLWVRQDAVAKRFEVAFEYTWKCFKAALDLQGVDAYGPKDSISSALTYKWIDDAEKWIVFLETRNAGVHDYFGLSQDEYTATAKAFLTEARNSLLKLPNQ